MNTLYYFVDETYTTHDGFLHCNIGGAIVPSDQIVDLEVELESALREVAQVQRFEYTQAEFKSSSFFPNVSDSSKLEIAAALARRFAARSVPLLVSHACVRKERLDPVVRAFGTPQQAIQHFAQFNVPQHLAELTSSNIVQIIADLGLSESFRPTYNVYASTVGSIPMVKAHGVPDAAITVPNWKRLPKAVFLDSKDSRVLQFSDLVVGLNLSERLGTLSAFKRSLLDALAPIQSLLRVKSVEWNRDDA